jgi:alpha,alpha-trehalose-phosphate synthase [UDP-forming]
MSDRYDVVVIANRLPVDRRDEPDGTVTWQPSPGGLVAALDPVLRRYRGAWVGWTGSEGEAPPPFDASDMHLVAVPLSAREIASYYEGMSNATLWPLYHDVIAPPRYHRHWWDTYVDVNRRFADVAATQAGHGATVWVQDYQLQAVPRMLRDVRPDLRIGFFNHIPFPPFELFAQLPWRRQVLDGLLGADLVGFQRPADANNFLRACRRVGLGTRRGQVRAPGLGGERVVRAQAFPISVDAESIAEIAQRPEVVERARRIREELGGAELILLGVDRLDYTKGILHRLQAVEELFADGRLKIPGTVFVQVATPSRERVESYRALRDEVETTVGRINGEHSRLGHPAVHYLHQSFPKEELVALYLAADVLLVTALRDGMNLVAKEYVASRGDERGALVLSEFTGAAIELPQAYIVNPHDIEGLKVAIVRAVTASPREKARRMRTMRKRVFTHDVAKWASDFLKALERSASVNEHRRATADLGDAVLEPLVPDLAETASVAPRDSSRSTQEGTMPADADLSASRHGGAAAAVGRRADLQVLERRGETERVTETE